MTAKMVIHSYPEGCGFAVYTSVDGVTWLRASRRPFNAVEVENRRSRFTRENPDAEVKETGGYGTNDPAIPGEWWSDDARII